MNTDDIARALRRQAVSVTEDQLRGPDEVRAQRSEHSRRPTRNSLIAIAAGLVTVAVVTTAILIARPDSAPLQAQAQTDQAQTQVDVERGMTFHNDEPQSASGACSKEGYVENASQLKSKTTFIVLGTVTGVRKDISVLETTPASTSNGLGSYTPEITLLPRILTVSVQQTIAGDVRPGSTFDMTDAGWMRGHIDDPNWYPLIMHGTARVEQGSTAIFALQKDPDGTYHFTCSGALPVDASGRVAGAPGSEDPLVSDVNGLTVAEFIKKIQQ
jgi:hypothetical protein